VTTFKTIFDKYDTDKSGNIEADELTQILTEAGITNVNPAEVQMMVKDFDLDGDGMISLNEFLNMMSQVITH
jgi:calcium-binding protein CML